MLKSTAREVEHQEHAPCTLLKSKLAESTTRAESSARFDIYASPSMSPAAPPKAAPVQKLGSNAMFSRQQEDFTTASPLKAAGERESSRPF